MGNFLDRMLAVIGIKATASNLRCLPSWPGSTSALPSSASSQSQASGCRLDRSAVGVAAGASASGRTRTAIESSSSMGMRMIFDDLWPHLETLTDSEVDAVYAAAGADKGYKTGLACICAAWLCGLAAYSFALPAFYRAFHPGLLVKSIVAVVTLLAIFLSIKAAYAINEQLFYRAVIRQLGKRTGMSNGEK
jgi:hypothetical protein